MKIVICIQLSVFRLVGLFLLIFFLLVGVSSPIVIASIILGFVVITLVALLVSLPTPLLLLRLLLLAIPSLFLFFLWLTTVLLYVLGLVIGCQFNNLGLIQWFFLLYKLGLVDGFFLLMVPTDGMLHVQLSDMRHVVGVAD